MSAVLWFVLGAVLSWFACAKVHALLFKAARESYIEASHRYLDSAQQYASTFDGIRDVGREQHRITEAFEKYNATLEALDSTVGQMLSTLIRAGIVQTVAPPPRNTLQRGEVVPPPLDPPA